MGGFIPTLVNLKVRGRKKESGLVSAARAEGVWPLFVSFLASGEGQILGFGVGGAVNARSGTGHGSR